MTKSAMARTILSSPNNLQVELHYLYSSPDILENILSRTDIATIRNVIAAYPLSLRSSAAILKPLVKKKEQKEAIESAKELLGLMRRGEKVQSVLIRHGTASFSRSHYLMFIVARYLSLYSAHPDILNGLWRRKYLEDEIIPQIPEDCKKELEGAKELLNLMNPHESFYTALHRAWKADKGNRWKFTTISIDLVKCLREKSKVDDSEIDKFILIWRKEFIETAVIQSMVRD